MILVIGTSLQASPECDSYTMQFISSKSRPLVMFFSDVNNEFTGDVFKIHFKNLSFAGSAGRVNIILFNSDAAYNEFGYTEQKVTTVLFHCIKIKCAFYNCFLKRIQVQFAELAECSNSKFKSRGLVYLKFKNQ